MSYQTQFLWLVYKVLRTTIFRLESQIQDILIPIIYKEFLDFTHHSSTCFYSFSICFIHNRKHIILENLFFQYKQFENGFNFSFPVLKNDYFSNMNT